MSNFANEFFWKSLRDFRTWASVLGLAFALIGVWSGRSIVLPSWVWSLIAVGRAFWIAWRAERRLYDDKNEEIKCDISLAKVVERIVGTANFFSSGNPSKVGQALLDLRELALQGKILVWGRRDVQVSDFKLYPRTEVQSAYWDEFDIDYMEFLKDTRGKTSRVSGTPKLKVIKSSHMYVAPMHKAVPDPLYSDLHFSRAQIDKLWPPPRTSSTFALHMPKAGARLLPRFKLR
jgi:hypothetical protein